MTIELILLITSLLLVLSLVASTASNQLVFRHWYFFWSLACWPVRMVWAGGWSGWSTACLCARKGCIPLLRFHEGIAWLMQIGMFLTLGLFVFPSRLILVAKTKAVPTPHPTAGRPP